MKTLVGSHEPERNPYVLYRRAYRGVMVDLATVLRKAGSLTGRR